MNKKLFYLMVIAQILFLLGMMAFKQSTLIYGTKVLLKPIPVDPTDIFRGDYITLRYEISSLSGDLVGNLDLRRGDKAYVQLENKGEYWDAVAVSANKGGEPYLKGTVNDMYGKVIYTLKEDKTAKEYTYEERVYEYYDYTAPEKINFKKLDKVQFSIVENRVAYVEKCPDEKCDSVDRYERFTTGVISNVDASKKEYDISYPIESYFIPKGTGDMPELRNTSNMLVEVALWKGDAIVTKLLYNGKELEFKMAK